MPRPAFPPTPGSSTDIAAKENSNLALLEGSFALPPAAIAGEDQIHSSDTSTASKASSVSSYRPVSPFSPDIAPVNQAGSRRRTTSGRSAASKDDFALPPPPTRPRKIIQMKMKPQEQETEDSIQNNSNRGSNTANTNGKKKQPSSTSAAGRKIARKTAHSLIERRRRSKMNEEFAVLKDMIPACQDQEMHKLAILQASIEYLRYLESCVTELKNNPHARTPTEDIPEAALSVESLRSYPSVEGQEVDMTDCTPLSASPPTVANTIPDQYHHTTAASPIYSSHSKEPTPALEPQHHQARHYSYSSSTASTMASPIFDARKYSYAFSAGTNSALTSPALKPQAEEASLVDHEATRALLMLNADRRHESGSGRGMSVRDLLSG